MTHLYRLRRQGTGRRRLDGERSGEGGWIVTVPDAVVARACQRLACEPSELRLEVGWDPRRAAFVYRTALSDGS